VSVSHDGLPETVIVGDGEHTLVRTTKVNELPPVADALAGW